MRGQVALEGSQSDDHNWVIANDFSCSGASGFGCVHFDVSTNVFTYGNYLHDNGTNCSVNGGNPTGAPCKFHSFYFTTNTNHVWVGWNDINPNPSHENTGNTGGCNGIQFYSTGGSDQFDIHVHDNTIRNVVCSGIAATTVNPGLGTVEFYNNVFYHDGTGPDPSGSLSSYSCLQINSGGAATGTVQAYNNSFYDCGSRGTGGSNAAFVVDIPINITNNVIQSTGSSELYVAFQSGVTCATGVTGSHNDWFGNGTIPCATQLAGDLNVNPLYTSTTLGPQNLHLQSSSPMIDAGLTISGLVSDHDGISRPQGAGFDIGAYEYFSGGSTVQRPNPPTNLAVTVH
jgi:hypothetical protein